MLIMSSGNLAIHYTYRDAGNNKRHTVVVLANPSGYSPENVREALAHRFASIQGWADILHFEPEALGWPTVFFDDHDEFGEDLTVHELQEIVPTDEPATVAFDLDDLISERVGS